MRSLFALEEKHRERIQTCIAVLSRIFWGPDTEDSHQILQGNYLKSFELLEPRVDFQPPNILKELQAISARFSDESAIYEYLEPAYVRLFINSREGIIASLYASAYDDGKGDGEVSQLMGPPAVIMHKRFESKGLSMSETMHEPPDHLSIELEYLYFLLGKGWAEDDRSLLDEAVSFAGEVMLPWVTRLRDNLADEIECRFYPLITSLLVSVLSFLAHMEPAPD